MRDVLAGVEKILAGKDTDNGNYMKLYDARYFHMLPTAGLLDESSGSTTAADAAYVQGAPSPVLPQSAQDLVAWRVARWAQMGRLRKRLDAAISNWQKRMRAVAAPPQAPPPDAPAVSETESE